MITLDAVPALRVTDPGTGTVSRRRPPASRTRSGRTISWALSRRTLLQAGTAVGMAALSIFPAARRAYADGYDIYGSCPSYASDQNCSPGCGPSPIFAAACNTSGTNTGFHKNDGTTWKLRPNQCYAGTYDGWLWRYQGACGACACSVERRCHDGYRQTSSGWVRSICRWNTHCGCLTSVGWPTTRRGQAGPNVYTVQHLLTAWHYSTTVDGSFGSGTETRVKQFQSARGIPATGVVDAQTWPVLVATVSAGGITLSRVVDPRPRLPIVGATVHRPYAGHVVRGVQRQLNKHAYGLAVDGVFGSGTEAAVRDFQRQNGLDVNGVVGQSTWRTLTGGAV
ncbi:peptidoglycan-binding protein [Micromonospora purpureochromogenes]|uniref:peptidoglycan-binding domain-containing protein n=1 Tax=Micromonospora purpureochromogenes TaxID=47872 RepID=UPI00340BC37B